jgi:hypothetical protein
MFYIYFSNNWCSLFYNIGPKVLDTYKVGPACKLGKTTYYKLALKGWEKNYGFLFWEGFVFGYNFNYSKGEFLSACPKEKEIFIQHGYS